jgi:hypothetical protein
VPFIDGISRRIGVGVGLAILLLLNLPFTGIRGRTIWWWDILGRADGGVLRAMAVFAALAGVGLCAAALLTRGMIRGLVFVEVTVIGTTLMLLPARDTPTVGNRQILELAIALLAACVMATSVLRLRLPGTPLGRKWHGVCGVTLVVAASCSLAADWLQYRGKEVPELFGGAVPPRLFVAGVAVAIAGHLAGLGCGVLGMLSAGSRLRPRTVKAAWTLACIALMAPALSPVLAAAGTLWHFGHESAGHWVLLMGRIALLNRAVFIPLFAGLAQILAEWHPARVASLSARGAG